jgi:TP901 family phage tail tape measure protein
MGLADVVAVLRMETGDFEAKLGAASAQLKGFSTSGESSMGKLSAALGSIPLPVVAVAAAITVATVAVVDLAAKMETADNKIAASADISTTAAKKIGDAFLNASIGTTISGQDMATAYAGVAAQLGLTEGHALSAAQASGIMKNAVDLAEASGTDLGSATSALAGTMQAYGLKAKDAAGVTNDLYNTAKLTGTGVDGVSSTLAKLHSTLGAVTPSVSDVSGLMVDLAEHGETGRKALAAVNTSLTGLLTPTAAAAKAQKDLGISVFDASGKFVGMGDLMGQLQPKLAGMTQEQQLATLKAIGFGSASKAMLDTIMAGPAAFDAASAAVSKTGSAHEAAAKATQGLSDSWKKIVVAGKDVGTMLGEQLLPVIEKVAAGAASFAQAVVKDWPTISAVIGGAIAAIKPIFETFAGWIKGFIEVIKGIVEFVKGVFTGNWSEAWDGIKKIFGGFLDAIMALPKAALDAIFSLFHTSWAKIGADINSAWSAIANFFTGIWASIVGGIHTAWSTVINFFTGLWSTISSGVTSAWNAIVSFFATIWSTITSAITTAWNTIVSFFTGIWTTISGAITTAWNAITSVFAAVWTTISSAITVAWNAVVTFFTGIWTTISGDITTAWNAIETVFTGVWTTISGAATTAWNAVVSFLSGIWSTISGGISSAWGAIESVFSGVWSAISGAATTAWNAVVSFLAGIWATISSAITVAWNAIIEFFGTIGAAVQTAFSTVEGFLEAPFTAAEGVIKTVVDHITGWLADIGIGTSNASSQLQTVANQVASFPTLPGGMQGPVSGAMQGPMPGHALGGSVTAGMASIVGERGPEIFTPAVNGSITPNSALGGMGGGVQITSNNTFTLQGTPESLLQQVEAAIDQSNQELIRQLQASR